MKFIFLVILFYSNLLHAEVNPWSTSLPVYSKHFVVTEELKDRVDFWVKVYSEISENEGLLHNVDNPEIIYSKLEFKTILENNKLTDRQKKNKISQTVQIEKIKVAQKWGIRNIKKIRLQMGLKERTQKALYLSGRYLPMMESIFKQRSLPIELTRLVFVESSFNVNAQSKVGASGLWQIMPNVAQVEGYIQRYYDKRNHPYYSTVLAADILETNYSSIKHWPLAITAYNHGLTGVKRMTNLAQSKKIEKLIESDKKTKTWGFASKNFYACFLAVLEVERRAKWLFQGELVKAKPLIMNRVVTKSSISKKVALSYFDHSYDKFKKYNPHINIAVIQKNKLIPAGIPLVLPKKSLSKQFKSASL